MPSSWFNPLVNLVFSVRLVSCFKRQAWTLVIIETYVGYKRIRVFVLKNRGAVRKWKKWQMDTKQTRSY